MRPELDDAQRETLRGWITPTTTDVLTFRSRIIDALDRQPMSATSLSEALGVDGRSWRFEVATFEHSQAFLGDVLTASDPRIESVRLHAAFVEALHQLEADRVIEHPAATPDLEIKGAVRRGSTTSGFIHRLKKESSTPVFRLASLARGWTASDHEAFDPSMYLLPPRDALMTSDGEVLLHEALEAHRFGRYLSSAIVLGVFVETAWYVAANRIATQSSPVAKLLQQRSPLISKVQDEVVKHLNSQAQHYFASNLDAWARSTRTVRNFGAHGNILGATSGSFTASSGAVRIMDSYLHLAELEQALQAIAV